MAMLAAIAAAFLLIGAGCASPSFKAMPAPGIDLTPNGDMAIQRQGNISISIRQASLPNRLYGELTAFTVAISNLADKETDFIPKEFLLFEGSGRQFFALPKEAINEVSNVRVSRTFITYGFAYSHYYNPWWIGGGPVFVERSYPSLLANALPTGPIRIFPRSIVEGNLYFNAPSTRLDSARIRITRLERFPKDQNDAPPEYTYVFPFAVIK
ncbi:MAG: hypothetical protein AB1656_03270 [Candidatus Omnitrophota bacterium]